MQGSATLARLVPVVASLLLVAMLAGCFGCGRDDEWTLLVTVDRGSLAVPDRVRLTTTQLVVPGGATLTSATEEVAGVDFFAAKGTSNVIVVNPIVEAAAVRVRGEALDESGAVVGSGVVEGARVGGTATLTLVLDGGGDGGVPDSGAFDAGSDAGLDAGDSGTDSGALTCGDGTCAAGETCATCTVDCGACPPACPDATCDATETCGSCPADCGACPVVCGDSACVSPENCATCPGDCGICPPSCPNGTCGFGENCSNCPMDCGPCCGNGVCEPALSESCVVCTPDCGVCPTNCSDTLDNDGDAYTDWPNDPGCIDAPDDDETDPAVVPECFDGMDNDGDALSDFPADPGCEDAADGVELDQCVPGRDIEELPLTGNVMGVTSGTSLMEASCNSGFTTSGPEAVWRLDVPVTADVTFSTLQPGTMLASSLSVRTDCDTVASEVTCVATAALGENVTVPALAPGSYFVIIDGQDLASGSYELAVSGVIASGDPCEPAAPRFTCAPGSSCEAGPGPTGFVCAPTDCADGVDNDGDLMVDHPIDPGCASVADTSEVDACPSGPGCPACGNGVDDDADLAIDYPMDSGCAAAGDTDETDCVYDFAAGSAMGWTFVNSCVSLPVGWTIDDYRSVSLSDSLYYGNPAARNFDCASMSNEGTATSPPIALPPSGSEVTFWYLWDSEVCSFDVLTLDVDPPTGPPVQVWSRCADVATSGSSSGGVFLMQVIDLSAYDGQTVELIFRFNTVDGIGNSGEGTYLDDIFINNGSCP